MKVHIVSQKEVMAVALSEHLLAQNELLCWLPSFD